LLQSFANFIQQQSFDLKFYIESRAGNFCFCAKKHVLLLRFIYFLLKIIHFMFIQMDFKCGSDSMIQSEQSPGSPDRQFCSSTTSAIGDFGNDSVIQDTVKEELPR
jgi:hypothetical protein